MCAPQRSGAVPRARRCCSTRRRRRAARRASRRRPRRSWRRRSGGRRAAARRSATAAGWMRSAMAVEIETPHGVARAHVQETAGADSIVVLGQGARGGAGGADLMIATRVALEEGFSVALVEQPYAVAGRRSPAPPKQLDAAWIAVVEQVAADRRLIAGGRSSGARVACRTAEATGAVAVVCLAFPVHPPGKPEKTHLDELEAVRVPVLVVQGESDPFGMPEPGPGREVVRLPGDHGLKKDLAGLSQAVRDWLSRVSARRS